MRATIEWSHDLLTPEERVLFASLAVFAGGCRLEAAEQVADADLDTLQALVEKSLLKHGDERFWMLETIREYAVEWLEAGGSAAVLRRRHAEFYLAVAERAELELEGGERQAESLETIGRDYANLRTALAWSLESGTDELGLRLAGALRVFWYARGYLEEGRRWSGDVLTASANRSGPYAKALFGAALLATMQGDWSEAKRLSRDCSELSLAPGERAIAAQSMLTLGRAMLAEGDRELACSVFEDAALLAREADAGFVVAMSSFNLGYAALGAGDYPRARREFEAAREQHAALENRYGVARSLAALGSVAVHKRHVDEAVALLKRSLELSRALGDKDDIAWALATSRGKSDGLRGRFRPVWRPEFAGNELVSGREGAGC